MSAWLVTDAHIDGLVQSLWTHGFIGDGTQTETGRMLLRENYLSLNARYGDPVPAEVDYTFRGIEAPLDPVKVAKSVSCYQYQACEHREWPDSDAYTLTTALHDVVVAEAGYTVDDRGLNEMWLSKAHEHAPWGIEDLTQLVLEEVST